MQATVNPGHDEEVQFHIFYTSSYNCERCKAYPVYVSYAEKLIILLDYQATRNTLHFHY